MIPADIKEMAQNDELVAELLAMGGPLFFKEYQGIRRGDVEGVVRARSKKVWWALVFFVLLWGTYLALFLISFLENDSNLVSQLLRVLSIGLYGAAVWIVYYNHRRLNAIIARIDAAEFSAD